MGKNKGKNKQAKVTSVFKVAGARSLKVKNKAKQVSGQLKHMNRQKVSQVDSELATLQTTLRQQKPAPVPDTEAVKSELQNMSSERVKQAEELKQNVQDIEKLDSVKL